MTLILINYVKLLLTISQGKSAEADIKVNGTITKLSFDDTSNNINIRNCEVQFSTSSGASFFMIEHDGVLYKAKYYQEVCDIYLNSDNNGMNFSTKLVTRVDIEKYQQIHNNQ